MSVQQEFVRRWLAWDARPGMRETALEFNDAVTELAELLEVTPSQLRDALNAARRDGLEHAEALARVLE